jgi:peptide/nickel transport system permease protein
MKFLLRRLGFFVVTLWAALTLNFLIPRLLPGGPATGVIAKLHHISPEALRAIQAEFGVHNQDSFLTQYLQYLKNCVTLNFGSSVTFQPRGVTEVVLQALPWTLGLVGVATVLAFILGTLLGMFGAWRRGGRLDSILPPVFVVLSAFTPFWIAMVFILIFALTLGWLPVSSGYSTGATVDWTSPGFIKDVLVHSILPGATLLITSIGAWILIMRNNMIATLAEDYVRMARAKGLSSWRIMLDYAARNAILPSLTGFAMSLGFVISGAILVEVVFAYPGVGFMLLQAVEEEDFPLIQALFLLITVTVLVAVLVSDLLTAWLDPRTRSQA